MRRAVLLCSMIVSGWGWAGLARAAEVVTAGTPEPAALPTVEENYVDIYTRQLAYREVALQQTALLKARQAQFPVLQQEAYHNYLSHLEALNSSRNDSTETAVSEALKTPETKDSSAPSEAKIASNQIKAAEKNTETLNKDAPKVPHVELGVEELQLLQQAEKPVPEPAQAVAATSASPTVAPDSKGDGNDILIPMPD